MSVLLKLVQTPPEPSPQQTLQPSTLVDAARAHAGRLRFSGLYVHVPFCVHKCHYCDFYSITRQTPLRMASFVDRLLAEAALWSSACAETTFRTVFFGGGTPSLLSADQLRRLVEGLRSRLDLSQVDEFTVECNPATVDFDWLAAAASLGVNRLSFGAQSFHRDELRVLERHHDPADVHESLTLARRAGFSRLSLDLIYGIPGQTLERWADSLEAALSCGTTHLSAYLLTYEPGTPLTVRRRLGQLIPLDEAVELSMLGYTRRRLREAGLPAYEISNFAAPGQVCHHNLNYWRGGSYLGLGPSAASHWDGWRWRNRPHLGEWERCVDAATLPAIDVEQLPHDRRVAERAYLNLRLTEGVVWDDLGEGARERFGDFVQRYQRTGLLACDDRRFWLTETGVAVADGLSAELLSL